MMSNQAQLSLQDILSLIQLKTEPNFNQFVQDFWVQCGQYYLSRPQLTYFECESNHFEDRVLFSWSDEKYSLTIELFPGGISEWFCRDELVKEYISSKTREAGISQEFFKHLKKFCHCYDCTVENHPNEPPLSPVFCRMFLCPTCGNKRCPHAKNHSHQCTNSNQPGQKGSLYE